jgi:hypothetical protein
VPEINQKNSKNFSPEEDGEGESDKQQTSGSEQQTQGEKFDNQTTQQTGGEHSEPDVKTMSSLEENLKELVNNNIQETNYIEVPKLNLDSVIISNQIIHDTCKEIGRSNSLFTKIVKSLPQWMPSM